MLPLEEADTDAAPSANHPRHVVTSTRHNHSLSIDVAAAETRPR